MTLLLVALFACSGNTPGELPPELPTPAPDVPTVVPAAAADVAADPPAGAPRVAAVAPDRMAARHILVAYTGAVGARPSVMRTKEEARARAEEALALVAGGADFAKIAKGMSDDSTSSRGGDLGGFMKGTMVAPFEAALAELQPGQISPVVETPFGFHVIRREPLVEVHEKHLLVTWAGADRAPPGVSRTKEQARARMDEVLARLAAGDTWEAVARRYSDGPLADDAGDLGWFGPKQLAPELDKVAFDLDIGATSQPVESVRGFHLFYRVE